MKKTWQILCLVMLTVSASPQQAGDKSRFIKSGNDTVSPAGYWLVKLNQPFTTNELLKLPFAMVRQVSPSEIIIRNPEKTKPPSRNLFLSAAPANSNWKLSPYLLEKLSAGLLNDNSRYYFEIQTSDQAVLHQLVKEKLQPPALIYEYGNVSVIYASPAQIKQFFLPAETIRFITLADRVPKEEINIIGFDNSVNKINKLHSNYPALNGNGIIVSIKENKPDSADIDFKGRFLSTPLAASSISSHATIMSTIIAGGGNSYYTGKGVAWNGTISSSSFAVLLPDNDAAYQQYKISVQNHSYGTGIENFYGADAAAYDASVNNNPSLIHVFSSGNSGNQPGGNVYNGITGFANLTGSFKMSKNTISVGSVDSFNVVPVLSSKGPAYDGRIKPELTAFGEDGSSGAAALVSGTAMVLQHVYKNGHANQLPDAALVKAVLLNSADDVGSMGIDFSSGFGNLNAWQAVKVMQGNQFFTGSVIQSATQQFLLSVPANVNQLKILLAWTDKPASANAFTALVNDLDITLTHLSTAQTWRPWVLNSAAGKDSLQAEAVRKRDSLNNVEQITISNPLPGNYAINVTGFTIPAGAQTFYVTYQWDTINNFEWTYPSRDDNLLPARQNVLRWQNNYTGSGSLAYKWAGSNNWQTIVSSTDIQTGYYKWTPPDTSTAMQLRMIINNQSYVSDTFTLSPKPVTGVGFNCADSMLLYWNNNPAGKYVLYRLANQYLQPIQTLTDTSIILPTNTASSNWFAIAPLLPFGKTGLRSVAFDYTQQGIACYIKNFTADLINNTASLNLDLGTTYLVKNIYIEKLSGDGYHLLQAYTSTPLLHYNFADSRLNTGLNTYRVKIELATGKIIYSNAETVYYFNNSKYIIYPNPASHQQSIHIIATELNNPVFSLFNVYGQKVYERTLFNLIEEIPANQFAKGVYFYVIFKDSKRDSSGKIVIE